MTNHPNRKSRRTAAVVSTSYVIKDKKVSKIVRKVPRKPAPPIHDHDADYAALLASVHMTFTVASRRPLFCTDAEGMNDRYLDHVGAERSVHDCHACRRFIETYGGLVTIDEAGYQTSAFWNTDTVPPFYRSAVGAMADAAARAHVTAPFLSSDMIWGVPKTGSWTHLSAWNPRVYKHALLTPGQAMAAKREDFKTVERALGEFSVSLLATAINVLESGHLQSSEKFITPLNWLAGLRSARDAVKDHRVKANLLWKAIATAPDGYCHPRAAVTGTLLEDLASGLPFAVVKRRFEEKVHPLQYQRPQAPPSAGNIADAEKIVEKLGIRPSLERRFARLDECQVDWWPVPPKAPASTGGVFSHLAPKGAAPPAGVLMPPVTMTWEKFVRTVLPAAETIRVNLVASNMPFVGLTTAVHANAPSIFKWDHPVAWYLYMNGSPPRHWNLAPGWAKVSGIVPLPPMWGDQPKPHLGEGVILVLDGCVDTKVSVENHPGNMLFPECLRSELHAIRSTIEAYSRDARLGGGTEASACGLDIRKGRNSIAYTLRVLTEGRETDYTIDRWD